MFRILGTTLAVASLACLSCNASDHHELESDPALAARFSPEEIDGLTSILDFVDHHLCRSEWSSVQQPVGCYENLFHWVMDTSRSAHLTSWGLPIDAQNALVAALPATLRDEIWYEHPLMATHRIPQAERGILRDTFTVVSLHSRETRLIDYFGTVEDPVLQHILDRANELGDFGPSTLPAIMQYSASDLLDERIRLFVALHIITHNQRTVLHASSRQAILEDIEQRFKSRRQQ